MLTQEDVQKLIEVFATRDEVATKKDLEELHGMFNDLQTSVDNYAHKADAYFQEMVMMNQKLNRHEKWFHLIADKLDIKLEY